MTGQTSAPAPIYRGSSKHKNRPTGEQKGTLCPEWTHRTPIGGFGTDVHTHDWEQTRAARLFAGATEDEASGRRYATAEGIAFEAKSTADGSWHGFPIPWESVPVEIKNSWLRSNAVSRRDLKKFFRFNKDDIHWAMQGNAE
jgi:hypothetical protein